ncbi:MFS general substrate transporter [Apiospora saccharicola]|uniref:MFS general substrate transporter n=1 Tax=Apiospora saccharicola TaxID=335842 RepID=A0ABR1VDE0_9PEZI
MDDDHHVVDTPAKAVNSQDPGGCITLGSKESEATDEIKQSPSQFQKRGFRFWAIIFGLCIATFQASFENSVIVTAGPAIVEDLEMGEEFIWITNSFFICCAAVQPLFGQLCNIFGRRWLMLFAICLFTLGSGICGGASSGAMLIAGRAVQGAGSGGIGMTTSIITADLVPLRERGYFLAIIMILYTVGITTGPIVGGAIVDSASWRWVFWMNLPIGGVALVLLYFVLHVHYDKEMPLAQKLRRIDWLGNGLLMAGTIAMLYALSYAGVRYSWDSWHTLVPLLIGFLIVVSFFIWEGLELSADLVMPLRLFRHRTSLISAINTFLHWMVVYWAMYFLPIYFQIVKLYSGRQTGVALLPMAFISIPGCAIAAIIISRTGKFKMLHLVGEGVFTIGMGLFALQWEGSTTAEWAIYQSIVALGGGVVMETLLPAFQAPVPESDQAAATATWAFIRSVGGIWGVSVPAAIFNNKISELSYTISDPRARQLLEGGQGYQHASAKLLAGFPEPVIAEIHVVYREALKLVWLVSVAFTGLAFLLFFFEKDVYLRKELETEYGLNDSEPNTTITTDSDARLENQRSSP